MDPEMDPMDFSSLDWKGKESELYLMLSEVYPILHCGAVPYKGVILALGQQTQSLHYLFK